MSLIDALKSYKQCDMDGVMCEVSRQAVEEAIERIAELEADRDAILARAEKHRNSVIALNSRIAYLEAELQKQDDEYMGERG